MSPMSIIAQVEGSGTAGSEKDAAETDASAQELTPSGLSKNPKVPPSKAPVPTMSPRSLIPTACVSLHAGPNTAPRSVALPDGDHSTASEPVAVSENPTPHPKSLMAPNGGRVWIIYKV